MSLFPCKGNVTLLFSSYRNRREQVQITATPRYENTYYCTSCPNGNEFSDHMPHRDSTSFCPACDAECEPDGSEALFDEEEPYDTED